MNAQASISFPEAFEALTGDPPFPWQEALYERMISDRQDRIPTTCSLPTGLGKTSVLAIWLIALAHDPGRLPRRLVYVVNRRTVVDQTTSEAERIRDRLADPERHAARPEHVQVLRHMRSQLANLAAIDPRSPLAISTLRGQFADNREWAADPARPAIIVGTVDMIGSRLLFSGYGVGFKGKPLHAGFLGQDAVIVHDEAHLEPAFQKLIEDIDKEQRRCSEFRGFHVMALSATSRGNDEVFGLTESDLAAREVRKRIEASKAIKLHPLDEEKMLADRISSLALEHKDSGRAVLVFVRKVDDVGRIVANLRKENQQAQQLTGTLRGLERDHMADPRKEDGCPIFARFLRPPKPEPAEDERWRVTPRTGTVYLICTSAGEVGVNISADHLVCDLSTFESMAQRFGRVNRFGETSDTRIDVVHPDTFDKKDELETRRDRTLRLLRALNGDGSPAALGKLDPLARAAAFTPEPVIPLVTDILLDAWAMTTIRDKLPGRPPVEPYLHGIEEWQPPETQVAWREDVDVIKGDMLEQYDPKDLLEDYPLKPHELLRDRSDRVFKAVATLAHEHPEANVWLVEPQGAVSPPLTLRGLADGEVEAIHGMTVILPPSVGGLSSTGTLDGAAARKAPAGPQKDDDAPPISPAGPRLDVADEWWEDKDRTVRRRIRVWSDDPDREQKLERMRLVRRIAIPTSEDDEDAEPRTWEWYARPRSADDDGSMAAREATTLDNHMRDVEAFATAIARAELKDKSLLREAVILAARFHDLGKHRAKWQRGIGNDEYPTRLYAKSGLLPDGTRLKPRDVHSDYRHEFGSLLDIQAMPEFRAITDEHLRDLVLHLVAAHHGRARPHFPADEADDPEPRGRDVEALAAEIPRRFARLQRRYGRWGLAYLESLLRAADYAASANPSVALEEAQGVPS